MLFCTPPKLYNMAEKQVKPYIYGKYFQKSLNFLYPLTGRSREETFKPSNSYLWWEDEAKETQTEDEQSKDNQIGGESIEGLQLIVHYKVEDNEIFRIFEEKTLQKSSLLESCYAVENGKIYIYNLAKYADIVDKFLRGKYSRFSDDVKKKILSYHGLDKDTEVRPGRPLHMALHPGLYFEGVSKEMKMPFEELKIVGELCDPFDKARETLKVKIIGNCEDFKNKSISLGSK